MKGGVPSSGALIERDRDVWGERVRAKGLMITVAVVAAWSLYRDGGIKAMVS